MKALALLALSFALPVFAQDCASTILDPGNLLGSQTNAVTVAANKLVQMGVDPHVIVDDPPYTPEQYVANMHQACPTWRSASGGAKNNIIAFIVFPKHRKVDIESGPEYAKMLNIPDLKQTYMNPSFRDKDWAMGMIKGMNQAAIQIQAYQQAALHPAQVTQQATDLHGLWVVMGWGVIILAICAAIWLIFYLLGKRNSARDAQQNAVNARNDAAKRLQDMRNWVETKEALSVPVAAQRAGLDAASEDFANVSGSETYNPNTKGLSAGQYTAIATRYESIRNAVRTTSLNTADNVVHIHGQRSAPSVMPNTGSRRTVVHEHYNDTTIVAPVIIEETPYYEPVRESYRAPDPEPTWTGGSSGFGSDSGGDGGSSSFDSGGDSGGFDSGGGSSDF